MMKPKLIVVLGPTGTGKTDLSIEIANYLGTEIISADSRQMFKEMPIGSAAPEPEQLEKVKHHFIASHSVHDYYNVGKYEEDVMNTLGSMFLKKQFSLLVGGSGMYIDSVCRGIDYMPEFDKVVREKLNADFEKLGLIVMLEELKTVDLEYYNFVDKNNVQRVMRGIEVYRQTGKTYTEFRVRKHKTRPFDIIKIGLQMDREELYDRINNRVDEMVSRGLEEEARKLYPYRDLVPLKTIGYREWFQFFDGDISRDKAIELIKRNSRHYVRRQSTWFKRYDEINWFTAGNNREIMEFVNSLK